MWRLKRWWYLSKFGYYHHKFDFGNIFSCLVKLQKNLKLKLRSKFNHCFTITMAIYKVLFEKLCTILILLMMGIFSRIGRTKKTPLPEICVTYPTMMTLGTVIPYPKKIQKIYRLRDRPLEFFRHQYFFTEN